MNPTSPHLNCPEGPDANLDALLAVLEGNKYDRAVLAIGLCIEHGIDTGPSIIDALKRRNFNARYIGLLLHKLTGPNPERHVWHRDEQGTYRCHPETA